MKIGLDNRAIKYSGIGIYTRNIYEYIMRLEHKVIMYEDEISVSRSSLMKKYFNSLRRIYKQESKLNSWFKENNLDIYHVPKNTGVPLFHSIPVVVTIHDVIPHVFANQYLSNIIERIYYEVMIRVSVNQSDHILTISEFSKAEIIRYYGVDASKISVVYLACNEKFRKIHDVDLLNEIRKIYNLPDKYILTIGGSEYRKNVEQLIKLYNKYDFKNHKLIVIGGKWRDIDLSAKYASENIIFLTNIPEDDLIAIYNMAEIFVFPSIYEGFGIPVLEGMACGVPVVTSNVSSMPEVGGEAALYFDPFDEHDMAEKIRRVLEDKDLRKVMIKKGLERVKMFSWEKCAEETLKVYNDVLKN